MHPNENDLVGNFMMNERTFILLSSSFFDSAPKSKAT